MCISFNNPWRYDTDIKVVHRSSMPGLKFPGLQDRIVHTLVDGNAATILFATSRDARQFIAFCQKYISVCQDHNPHGAYLRPNDPGVSGSEVVHLSLSKRILVRMLSYVRARMNGEKFFDCQAENGSCFQEPTNQINREGASFMLIGLNETPLILL